MIKTILILTIAAAILGGYYFPSIAGDGTVDQSHTGNFCPACAGFSIGNFGNLGQEFTPTASNLVAVDLQLADFKMLIGQTYPVTVNIRSTTVTGPILGTTTMTITGAGGINLGTPRIDHFDFSTPIPLTPNNLYVIEVTGPFPSNRPLSWNAEASAADTYTVGRAIIDSNPTILDFGFVTYFGPSLIKEIQIDIKPGSDPSSVSCKNLKGNVPVAVFGSNTFDATTIDLTSLELNGVPVTEVHNKIHLEDLNNDGFDDAVLHLDKAGVCKATLDNDEYPLKESADATLTGSNADGDFEGIGDIRIVKR